MYKVSRWKNIFSIQQPNKVNKQKEFVWRKKKKISYLVGTTSAPSMTNSHDVILIGHAMWPKLSRTNVSHDEYGVCESECNLSDLWRRARRFGVVPDTGDVDALNWSMFSGYYFCNFVSSHTKKQFFFFVQFEMSFLTANLLFMQCNLRFETKTHQKCIKYCTKIAPKQQNGMRWVSV